MEYRKRQRYIFSDCSLLTSLPDLSNDIKSDIISMRYIMIYKISNKRSIKILGEKFVDNNKNEGNIIYNNHKYHLIEEFPIQNKNSDKLKIVMELSMNIRDLSCMFENCDSLLEFRDYYDIREINIEEENKYSELIEIEKNKYSKHLNDIYNKIYYHDNENYHKINLLI